MVKSVDPDLRSFLSSPCRHGYSARKRCPRCQAAIRGGRDGERRPRRRSVYEDR